jgi:putative membrane protein
VGRKWLNRDKTSQLMNTISPAPAWANKKLVNVLSIAIPLAVALLIGIRQKLPLGEWTSVLPHVIGFINTLTACVLVAALVAIKGKNINLHQNLMWVAVGLGAVFLVLYILYHISNPSTPYGGTGAVRYVYYFLLISHVVLSIGVVRFVLLALYYALNREFDQHRRVVKLAFPIWLYVSVSGVVVYLMISPYYQ